MLDIYGIIAYTISVELMINKPLKNDNYIKKYRTNT